jgi:hypothetical protein
VLPEYRIGPMISRSQIKIAARLVWMDLINSKPGRAPHIFHDASIT